METFLTYQNIMVFSFILVGLVLIASLFVDSPFGKFASDKMGINLGPRIGWFLMELPAMVSFIYFYFKGQYAYSAVPLFFLFVWVVHYLNRGFIFPFLIRAPKNAKGNFSIAVIVMGWLVTTLHGYLNGSWVSEYGDHLTLSWALDPRFIIGIILYYTGFALNIHSDNIVRNLRSKEEIESGEKVYRIPFGGGFKFVTNPSYLGELMAFTGFAIATWGPGGVFVLLISAANLIPRSFATHKWYKEKFENYPKDRKVLIPFLI